ncbi:MAG TPA: NADH-quinone oxidoreductase subunit NuoK [Thermoanaerobaculia bacterium]|nr:NADH-quinone oxidoreductase subunit NuoK [Thermoanaerobaculia bacterium]HUM29546.1 NADH-quinone oxidoreductase subunit NuoK [Thermoanaerobaculia bacterium]HXK67929.1 NADH-quinone oxidoreductase subunit NuoK [Thermoanaerobaculia bacterium]
MITTTHYLVLSALLFSIGMVGVMVRKNLITLLMCLELMLNAVNLNLVAFSQQWGELTGQVFVIFVITVAAGEAAIGLGIIITIYRQRRTVEADVIRSLEG